MRAGEKKDWTDDHVHQGVRARMHEDAQARIAHVRSDQFIPFGRLPAILARMRKLVAHPNQGSPKGIILIGDSQMGKSALITEFHREFPASDNVAGEHAQIPVLVIQFPDSGGEGVYGEICRTLIVKLPNRPTPLQLRSETMDVIDRVGMKVLVIDELANVLTRRAPSKAASMNQIKFIMNEHKRPIVLGVTKEAYKVIQHDDQIKNRFVEIRLLMPAGVELAQLVHGWIHLQPLRKKSEVGEKFFELFNKLHANYTGDLIWHLQQMAVDAIETGTECLSYEGLVRHIELLEGSGVASRGLEAAKIELGDHKVPKRSSKVGKGQVPSELTMLGAGTNSDEASMKAGMPAKAVQS